MKKNERNTKQILANQRAYANQMQLMRHYHQFQKMMAHFRRQIIKDNKCNFHNLMTSITPFICNNKDMKVIEIFKFFIKTRMKGIDCEFQTDSETKKVTYFPYLSSLQIEFNDICDGQSVNNENNANDLNSTFDRSMDSISRCLDEGINYKIKTRKKETGGFIEIINNYPKLFYRSLGEISADSYFSVLWTPNKSDERSFLVLYKFTNGDFTKSFRFIPVLGVKTKIFDDDQEFWFRDITRVQNYSVEVSCQNWFYFCDLADKMRDFAKRDEQIKNVDYEAMGREN